MWLFVPHTKTDEHFLLGHMDQQQGVMVAKKVAYAKKLKHKYICLATRTEEVLRVCPRQVLSKIEYTHVHTLLLRVVVATHKHASL